MVATRKSLGIVPAVVSQHAEDAAFQWILRDAAVRQPHYSLEDLVRLDDRLVANLDGLSIAGEPGWDIVNEQLALAGEGEVFMAAVLALESGDTDRWEDVLSVGAESIELARPVTSALGWLPFAGVEARVLELLESDVPLRRRVGVAASAIHRREPASLPELLTRDEPVVQARALRLVGELGLGDLASVCERHLNADDVECQFSAAWSAARFKSAGALSTLREMAESGSVYAERSADLAARTMERSDALAWQKQLAADTKHLRLACVAAGAIGDPSLVPWLIETAEVDAVARPAGAAISSITGLDLAYEDLERDWPEGFESGPTEDALDENVALDDDENLPWPASDLLKSWWGTNGGQYQVDTRYLCGQPISADSCQEVLKVGTQTQRAAAALELALIRPRQPLFEVRACGDQQRRALASTPGQDH